MKATLIAFSLTFFGLVTIRAQTPTSTPSELLHIGEVGVLRFEGKMPVPVATTKEAFNEFIKAAVVGDDEGTAELIMEGRLIPVKQGTKVRKLDIHGFLGSGPNEVRILEGEYRGKKGFVSSDWIKPLPDKDSSDTGLTPTTTSPASAASPVPNVSGSNASDQRLTKFTNQKYGCSILVPVDVFPNPPQQPDDEHTKFLSTDGRTTLELVVDQNPQKRAVAEVYREWIAQCEKKGAVDYKTVKGNWFVVSGDASGRGYYTKCVARDNKLFIMNIEYDEEADAIWENTLTTMSRSFDGGKLAPHRRVGR